MTRTEIEIDFFCLHVVMAIVSLECNCNAYEEHLEQPHPSVTHEAPSIFFFCFAHCHSGLSSVNSAGSQSECL